MATNTSSRHVNASLDSSGSPDPLTLPSSPIAARAASRSPTRQTTPSRRSPTKTSIPVFSSPAKSVFLETGPPGQNSPWRIKVTLQAEPNDQRTGTKSPTQQKLARTTKVPLKTNSSSPAKKPRRQGTPRAPSTMNALDIPKPKPLRKRKGTPLRESVAAKRHSPDPTTDEEGDDEILIDSGAVASAQVARPSLSKSRAKRRSLEKMPTPPSKKLSQAREQLDHALQEAVGYEAQIAEEEATIMGSGAGDLTVSMNEDFTMVSIESLQSYNRANKSRADLDKSAASISYMPSSPPQRQQHAQVEYPDLSKVQEVLEPVATTAETAETAKQETSNEPTQYDAMSWRVTGPAKSAASVRKEDAQARRIEQLAAWRMEREAASQERQTRLASQPARERQPVHERRPTTAATKLSPLIQNAPVTQTEPQQEQNAHQSEDEDIWQEEASRSLVEDDVEEQVSREKSRSPKLDDLFVDEIVRPRRAKIPRTWRRTSGNDFTYSDSPARDVHHSPAQPAQEKPAPARHVSNGSTGGESERSVVLTPPSTDEDDDLQEDAAENGDTSDLTEPDAAATMLQHQEASSKKAAATAPNLPKTSEPFARRPAVTRVADASQSHVDGDTTGFVWRHISRPQRPGAPKLRAMDLSELLNLQSSPAKQQKDNASPSIGRERVEPQAHNRPARTQVPRTQATQQPWRSRLGETEVSDQSTQRNDSLGPLGEVDESYESKASDQRQLLDEVRSVAQSSPYAGSNVDNGAAQSSLQDDSYVSDEEMDDDQTDEANEIHHPVSHSYEEHLNVESPQKIRVKFNDSSGNSSLLFPRRDHSDLFGNQSSLSTIEESLSDPNVRLPKTPTLKRSLPVATSSAADSTTEQKGLFGWLTQTTSTLLSSLIPRGPTFITPSTQEQNEIPPTTFPQAFTMHIRSRYGVLPDVHPWTFAHYRTLQRMLNSCTSGRADSVVPKPGSSAGVRLSRNWQRLIGTTQPTFLGDHYVFQEQHALVLVAFFQCAVPAAVTDAMDAGEVAFLGDRAAFSHRGRDWMGRRGKDFAFPDKKVPRDGKRIEAEFVLAVLGDCVLKNVVSPPEVEERRWRDAGGKKLFFCEHEERGEGGEEDEEDEEEEYEEEDRDTGGQTQDVEMSDASSSSSENGEGHLTPDEEE